MASMTILRSIDFSRATASAICNSSSRFALTPACAILCHPPRQHIGRRRLRPRASAFVALLRAPQRLANKFVRQHQPRLGNDAIGSRDLRPALVRGRPRCEPRSVQALEHAAKPLAACDQLLHLDLGLVSGPGLKVRWPHQQPVDAGRGHLQRVAARRSGRARPTAATSCARCPRNPPP